MGLKDRSAERRKRIVGHVAKNFQEAEDDNLEFWLGFTPEERISIHAAMSRAVEREVAAIMQARKRRA